MWNFIMDGSHWQNHHPLTSLSIMCSAMQCYKEYKALPMNESYQNKTPESNLASGSCLSSQEIQIIKDTVSDITRMHHACSDVGNSIG